MRRAAVEATLDAAILKCGQAEVGRARDRALWAAHVGWTAEPVLLRELAAAHGLTRQRVLQIYNGINAYLRQGCPALAPKELTP